MRKCIVTVADEIRNETVVFELSSVARGYKFIQSIITDRNPNFLVKEIPALRYHFRKGHVSLVATDSHCKYYIHDGSRFASLDQATRGRRQANQDEGIVRNLPSPVRIK